MIRKATMLTSLLPLLMCGGPKEETGDEVKSAAVEIPTGTTVDDKVSSSGDPVDWKRFEVEVRTPAKIGIYWDNPDISAEVTLRDIFGGPVGSVVHAKGAPADYITAELRDGTYFLEIRAKQGSSVYTVEVLLGEASSNSGVPRPE